VRVQDWIELQSVHPVLIGTVALARARWLVLHPQYEIRVTDGYRTAAAQEALFKAGKSRTLNSAHREGLAVDLAICFADGRACDWDLKTYENFNVFMHRAFASLGPHKLHQSLLWGGNWVKLRDGVHWQLQGFEPLVL